MDKHRGYFGIGIEHTKNPINVGTLWRSANILGAAFIFTVGRRYKTQCSDTLKSWRHIPLYHYVSLEQMYETGLPYSCKLIGVELDNRAIPISDFIHPQRGIYLLGAEDNGLSKEAMERCHDLIVLPGERSMNVAVAGSIVMFDRINKLAMK